MIYYDMISYVSYTVYNIVHVMSRMFSNIYPVVIQHCYGKALV
jgi:hypothetical protein